MSPNPPLAATKAGIRKTALRIGAKRSITILRPFLAEAITRVDIAHYVFENLDRLALAIFTETNETEQLVGVPQSQVDDLLSQAQCAATVVAVGGHSFDLQRFCHRRHCRLESVRRINWRRGKLESKLARNRLLDLFALELLATLWLLTLLAVAPPTVAQTPAQGQQAPAQMQQPMQQMAQQQIPQQQMPQAQQQQFNQPQIPPQGTFLDQAPSEPPGANTISDLLATGRHFISTGNAAQAIAPLSKAIETKPNSAAVYFWRAVAYDEMGEPKKAMHDYSKSLNICKSQGMDSAQLRINLGNSLVKLNYLKEAIYDYQRAIEIEPENGVAHMLLARALLFKGDYENALSHLRKCEETGFSPNTLPYLKALALSGLGQVDDAKRELGQCLTDESKAKAPLLFKQANQLYKSLSPQ